MSKPIFQNTLWYPLNERKVLMWGPAKRRGPWWEGKPTADGLYNTLYVEPACNHSHFKHNPNPYFLTLVLAKLSEKYYRGFVFKPLRTTHYFGQATVLQWLFPTYFSWTLLPKGLRGLRRPKDLSLNEQRCLPWESLVSSNTCKRTDLQYLYRTLEVPTTQ